MDNLLIFFGIMFVGITALVLVDIFGKDDPVRPTEHHTVNR